MTADQVERRAIPRLERPHLPCPCAQGGLGRLRCALRRAAPEPIELLSATLALVWATWLLCSPELFDRGSTYRIMRGLAPQLVWGSGALTVATLQLGALLYGGRAWRLAATAAGGIGWCFFALVLFLAAPGLVAGPSHLTFALACGWAHFRHRRGC